MVNMTNTVAKVCSAPMTPTMKLKRKPIDEKYAEEIEALYSS